MRANCQLERRREPTEGHRGYGGVEDREFCFCQLTGGLNIERFLEQSHRATTFLVC